MFRPLREESGYSLVEVMVAITLLALSIIPIVSMLDAGVRASVVGSRSDSARALANERLEIVRALPYNRPGPPVDSAVEGYRPGTPVSGNKGIFSYSVTTTYYRENAGAMVSDPSDNSVVKPMMQVVVRVNWGVGNSYTTTGFVAEGAD